MGLAPDWQPDRYRSLLKLRVRIMQLDPRFRSRFDSSDLVQATLLRAHEKRDQFQGQTDAELLGWLNEILDHVVIDEIRKATAGRRDVHLEQSLPALLAESSGRMEAFLTANQATPSQQVEREEMLLRVSGAVDQLPQDQRDVIVLRYGLDTPVNDIATQLGRTPKSVAGLLRRGKQTLRQLLAADA